MSYPNRKRRRFLKKSARLVGGLALLGGGGAGLTACASLDTLFTADKRDFEKEVFIIGAGAAGLMAAHTLKKNQIPFRLFEASGRPGGRMYTVNATDGTPLEMGADTFEAHHKVIFELLREFRLDWEETLWDPNRMPLWKSSRGEFLTDEEYQVISASLIQRMIQNRVKTFGTSEQYQILSPFLAQELDTLSMSQYLRVNWVRPDERVVQYWEAMARAHYSATASRVSALRWIWDQQADRRTRSLYRVKGGWQFLNRMMFDRVAGVIPEHLVRLRWALSGIRKTENGFRCIFRTPEGTKILMTRNLILALPVNQYAKIDGFMNLNIGQEKKQALKSLSLGESSKVFAGFKPNSFDASERVYLRDQVQMSLFKGNQVDWVGGLRGGLNSQWTMPDIENWKADLLTSGASVKEGQFDFHVLNWKDKPYIQGARSLWGPGQWGDYSIVFESGDFDGSLEWAGEHVPSTEKGTVNAALVSGQMAALKMVERIKSISI